MSLGIELEFSTKFSSNTRHHCCHPLLESSLFGAVAARCASAAWCTDTLSKKTLAQLEHQEDLCWAANSSKAGMVVGACTAARFHTAEENPGCPWCATRSLIAFGATIDAQPSSTIYVVSCLAPANAFLLSSMIYCHEFWLLAFLMLSSRLITCGEPIVAPVSTSVSSCMGESK